MKIAIYGGSFNPVHSGHLIVAEEIRQLFNLDKVLFVPAANPPHKALEMTDPHHRITMVKLAIESNPCFAVSDIEIKRGGVSYTIDTLKQLREIYGEAAKLYFIIGSDAFLELDTWKQSQDLLRLADFIVIERPGASLNKTMKFLARFCSHSCQVLSTAMLLNNSLPLIGEDKVFFVQATLANISSSAIRGLVKSGKSIRYIVPEIIKNYIEKNKLYL